MPNEIKDALDRSAQYLEQLKTDTRPETIRQVLLAQHDAIAEIANALPEASRVPKE